MGIFNDIGNTIGDAAKDVGKLFDDIGSAVGGLFGGPGAIIGLVFTAGATILAGPAYNIPIFVAGALATRLLIKQRNMTSDEMAFARMVFGNTIPYDRIILTNVSGPNGRKFTVPDGLGNILVNLSDAYDDPTSATQGNSYPLPGQVFVHELTHAWQIVNGSYTGGFLCEAALTQFRQQLGQDVYNQTGIRGTQALGRNFRDYGVEEQATIIDSWYQLLAQTNPIALTASGIGQLVPLPSDTIAAQFWPYVTDNIRVPNYFADYHAVLPPSQLGILVSQSPDVYWQVTFPSGVWRYTFSPDGTATYQIDDGSHLTVKSAAVQFSRGTINPAVRTAAAAPPPTVPAAPIRAAALRAVTRTAIPASAFTPAPVPAPTVVPARASSPSGGLRAGSPAVSLTALKGNGKWLFQSGKVAITWDDGGRELWDLPLSETNQTGRSLSGEGTFTAQKIYPGPSGPPEVIH